MREIKFRAWDKENKEFINSNYAFLDFLGNFWFSEKGKNPKVNNDTHILNQFTGLHDKNGKEIYEGDVVELSVNEEKPSHSGRVEYIAPKFFVMDNKKSGLILTDKYNVIGNIHENPELLNEN